MSDELFTPEQVADRLGVTEDWLRRKASAGEVPSRKIGRKRRFTEQDIQDYLEAARFKAADPLVQSSASRSRRRAS